MKLAKMEGKIMNMDANRKDTLEKYLSSSPIVFNAACISMELQLSFVNAFKNMNMLM